MLSAMLSMTTRLLGVASTLTDYDEGLALHRRGDFERAAPLMKKAAQAGYYNGATVYASMLLLGQGVPEDGAEALRWLEFAVDGGHAEAKSLLGMALATGKAGVKRDVARATKLLKECAQQGDLTAVEMLKVIRKCR